MNSILNIINEQPSKSPVIAMGLFLAPDFRGRSQEMDFPRIVEPAAGYSRSHLHFGDHVGLAIPTAQPLVGLGRRTLVDCGFGSGICRSRGAWRFIYGAVWSADSDSAFSFDLSFFAGL
jgi:hypothetical protein